MFLKTCAESNAEVDALLVAMLIIFFTIFTICIQLDFSALLLYVHLLSMDLFDLLIRLPDFSVSFFEG